MLAELIAAGAALGMGGLMAAWQHRMTRRRRAAEERVELSERGPYRQGEAPGAVVDPQTGGYPMPPPFDDGWTPKA